MGAAVNGHVHVLKWAIENGAPLVLPTAEETVALHALMLSYVYDGRHTQVLEWLLAVHPPILEHHRACGLEKIGDIRTHVSTDAFSRILELLAPHLGPAKLIEVLQPLAQNAIGQYFAPSVTEWCMQQGVHFDSDFFDHMMSYDAQEGDVPHMEHYLRLGGMWRAKYFRVALASGQLTFCQWAHRRGDLELDFSLDRSYYPKKLLAWLASMGLFLSVTEWGRLEAMGHDSCVYIIEHYPRYALQLFFSDVLVLIVAKKLSLPLWESHRRLHPVQHE